MLKIIRKICLQYRSTKKLHKWTHAIQTHVVQGSTVYPQLLAQGLTLENSVRVDAIMPTPCWRFLGILTFVIQDLFLQWRLPPTQTATRCQDGKEHLLRKHHYQSPWISCPPAILVPLLQSRPSIYANVWDLPGLLSPNSSRHPLFCQHCSKHHLSEKREEGCGPLLIQSSEDKQTITPPESMPFPLKFM